MGKKEPFQFETAFQRLEEIVALLERGEESLEKSLQLFEEGIKLSDTLKARLDQAEQRIKVLVADSKGDLKLEDRPPEQ